MASAARICRIITRLNIGGPAVHVILLAHGLRARGFETVLVAGQESPHEGSLRDLAATMQVHPVWLPELGRALRPDRDLVALAKLVRLLRRERPAIVHTHTAKAGALGRLAARWAGIPIILHTFHGHVFNGYFHPAVARLFLAIERGLAAASTMIVTLSEGQRQECLRLGIGSPETVVVVPPGLELERYLASPLSKGVARRQLGVRPEVPLVGIIGRLVPIKDHETFLLAAADLHRLRPEVQFLIVGDGELRPALERRARAIGLDGSVRFLGWRRDLEYLYADFDLVVLSSLNEGTPVSLIEAMAAGLPVVATRVGGIPDLVADGKTGLLVPPRDPGALSRAMQLLLDDPCRRREMGALGRQVVAPLHGAAALIERMSGLYDSLLQRCHRARASGEPGVGA